MADNLTDQQREEIDGFIFAGQKIAAVKALREATGADLLTAKRVVEARAEELRQSSPEKFAARKGAGCMGVLVLVALAGAAACVAHAG